MLVGLIAAWVLPAFEEEVADGKGGRTQTTRNGRERVKKIEREYERKKGDRQRWHED